MSAAQEAARAAGKFAGTVCGAANAQSLADMGYQVLAMGMDAWAVAEWARQVTINSPPSSSKALGVEGGCCCLQTSADFDAIKPPANGPRL